MAPGTELDVLTGLGNGYDVSRSGEHPLLVGGGVGIPPLYGLAKRLTAQGKRVTAVLGFNRESEIFLAEEFRALGVRGHHRHRRRQRRPQAALSPTAWPPCPTTPISTPAARSRC